MALHSLTTHCIVDVQAMKPSSQSGTNQTGKEEDKEHVKIPSRTCAVL